LTQGATQTLSAAFYIKVAFVAGLSMLSFDTVSASSPSTKPAEGATITPNYKDAELGQIIQAVSEATEAISASKYNEIRDEERSLHKGKITLLPGERQPSIPTIPPGDAPPRTPEH
jgi:hypothetical protein